MPESVQTLLDEFAARNADYRLQLFDVSIDKEEGNSLSLSGRILDQAGLAEFLSVLAKRFPDRVVDTSGIKVLRVDSPHSMTVSTNLTGLYAGPTWLAEMQSQMFFGWKLEVLEERGDWVLVRQLDGYLGWVYLPYLTDHPAPDPTHLVIAPASYVRTECPSGSQIVGRILCGTAVQVVRWTGQCAEIDSQVWGWVTASELRALEDLPKSTPERRVTLAADANRLMGVPYLWGGCTAMGIDCSGFAHLLHRLIGVRIPRDADLQYNAGRKVEAPYQPGDLLFFCEDGGKRGVSHVGISLGGWRMIHSSRAHNGVYIDDVQDTPELKQCFMGACSFL